MAVRRLSKQESPFAAEPIASPEEYAIDSETTNATLAKNGIKIAFVIKRWSE